MMNGTAGMMECMSAMGMMGMAPMGWIMGLFWILLLVLVGWGIYRLFATRNASVSSRETPLETLQRRYAEGDLSTEEYEERRRALSS